MKTKAQDVGDRRVCSKCGTWDELKRYPKFTRAGKTYYEGQCWSCKKKYHKKYVWASQGGFVAAKKKVVEEYKRVPCADCKGTFPAVCMDFDHVRGEKVEGIAKMVAQSWSMEKLSEEIAKCDLVCANCHRIRTHRDDGVHHRKRIRAGREKAGLKVKVPNLLH